MRSEFYTLEEVEFAQLALWSLLLILPVAFAAFWLKSRLAFFLGSLGALSGWVIPQRNRTYPDEYLFACLGDYTAYSYEWWPPHLLFWGLVGAILGCFSAWVWRAVRFQDQLFEELKTAEQELDRQQK